MTKSYGLVLMVKSLLSQARQIASSVSFEKLQLDMSDNERKLYIEDKEFLEQDLNVIRSIIDEIIGSSEWTNKTPTSITELNDLLSSTINEINENRRIHEIQYHNTNVGNVEFIYSTGVLSKIVIFRENNITIFKTVDYNYVGEELTSMILRSFEEDGITIFSHVEKTFIYTDENLSSINVNRVV